MLEFPGSGLEPVTVNATGTFLCTQAFLPGMVERHWGRIVNMASVAGLGGGKYIAAYSASKHAVVGFTRSVAAEVAGTGVTVNAVCPGYVDTDMTRESVARIAAKTGMPPEAALRAALATTGQLNLISPEHVARAVLTLCEDAPCTRSSSSRWSPASSPSAPASATRSATGS